MKTRSALLFLLSTFLFGSYLVASEPSSAEVDSANALRQYNALRSRMGDAVYGSRDFRSLRPEFSEFVRLNSGTLAAVKGQFDLSQMAKLERDIPLREVELKRTITLIESLRGKLTDIEWRVACEYGGLSCEALVDLSISRKDYDSTRSHALFMLDNYSCSNSYNRLVSRLFSSSSDSPDLGRLTLEVFLAYPKSEGRWNDTRCYMAAVLASRLAEEGEISVADAEFILSIADKRIVDAYFRQELSKEYQVVESAKQRHIRSKQSYLSTGALPRGDSELRK